MRSRLWIVVVLAGVLLSCGSFAMGQEQSIQRPSASFRAYRADGVNALVVVFDGTFSTDSDGRIVSYQWLFGDGRTGSGATVEHAYARDGEYSVTLRVVDNDGATDMITRTVDTSSLEDQVPAPATTASTGSVNVRPTSAPVGNGVGNRAPAFTLPGIAGGTVSLSDYFGKLVALDFWFSTCSTCVSTLPHLEELAERFPDDLVVIVVVLDRDAGLGRDFFLGRYEALVVVHENEYDRPVRTAYGVGGTPHTFLIDRTGEIRFTGRPKGLTEEMIRSLL